MPPTLATELAREGHHLIALGDGDLVVVVSHDCDICQHEEAKEPWIELLAVRVIGGQPHADRTLMKNPRVLEFTAKLADDELVCRVLAAERWFAARGRLSGTEPQGYLETKPADLIPSWLSRRYIRQAFPTEFNRRWAPAAKRLRACLKANGRDLSTIFIAAMTDEELPAGADYGIVLRGTMLDEDFAVPERRDIAQLALGQVAAILNQCDGIHVEQDDLVSEAEVTLADVRVMKRWDPFDALSLADEPEAAPRVRPPGT